MAIKLTRLIHAVQVASSETFGYTLVCHNTELRDNMELRKEFRIFRVFFEQ
jgi:hypothetical protein